MSKQKAYLLIDEYDLYYAIMSKTGFVRTFYEVIKSGAQEGAISRIFMTGVSPIMLDDLTSGFNIATNITLDYEFNDSLGFTQSETEEMLEYYTNTSNEKKGKALENMKHYYNGYLFNEVAEQRLYNPDMVLHFMRYFQNCKYPDVMIDMNVKTDYSKIQRLINEARMQEESKIEQILEQEEIITKLIRMFPLEAIRNREELISLMFYMGMLTIDEPIMANVKLRVPNLVIKEIYWEYIYNRDLIKMEEKHIKMIFLSFLTMNQVYIPYSELEVLDFSKSEKVLGSFKETKLHMAGYSDIVLVPDSRYGVKNSQIWELKYIKENENPKQKIEDAKEQINRYEKDEKFLRLAGGTKIYKYIVLAYKDRVEIL